MANWTLLKAIDLIDFNPKESLPQGTTAKKVVMEHLQPFRRDISAFEVAPFSGGSKFRNGDTLMARITPCLENGKTALVNILEDNEVGFGSTEYIVLRAKPNISDKNFVYYLAISPKFRDKAIKSMVGSSGRQRVQQGVMNDIEIYAPHYSEQVEIGSFLCALDDKIANNTKINHNLEAMAKAIFKSWFIDFEPFTGYKFVNSKLGPIPAGWEIVKLSDVVVLANGYSYKSSELVDSSIAMATIKNFERGGGFKLDGFKDLKPLSKIKENQFVNIFDILVAHTDLTLKAEVIGNTEMLLSTAGFDRIIASMDLVKVVPKRQGLTNFILYSILSDFSFKKHCLGYINGTTVLHLSKKAIPEYTICLPLDPSILGKLDSLFSPIYKRIALNLEESRLLIDIRNFLLPRLISGELSVDSAK
jgi:type I restriction enzyme S subunit